MDKFKVIALNRHRMGTDGKGVTTLVALAGCPLKCKYCLNKIALESYEVRELTENELLSKVIIDYYLVNKK